MSTSISATEIGLPDNAKLKLGTGEDLEIYHDGSNSFIKDAGTGSLVLNTNALYINNAANTENMISAGENGNVELYYDNSKIFETGADQATITGKLTINRTSNDEKLILSGSASPYIRFKESTTNKAYMQWSANGYIEIYNQETSKGMRIGGQGAEVLDNIKFTAGDSQDLQIYHDGSNSRIHDDGTGVLAVSGSEILFQNAAQSETVAKFVQDGQCELYYNNTKRFETLTDGTQSRGLTKHLSEDQNVTQTIQPLYLSVPTNTTKTITLTLLLGTGRFTAGGYANAGQGALALNIFFGGAMFATQHYDVNVLQNNAMQNTSTSLTKNGTSYVIAITNNSSSYPLNLSMLLESTGRPMNYAVA